MTQPRRPRPIRAHYGTAVTGEQRYERPDLDAALDDAVSRKNGARLFGLRRIGKSSDVLACQDRLRNTDPPHQVVFLDAQGFTSEAQLLVNLLKQLQDAGWRQRFTRILTDDNAIALAARSALEKYTGQDSDIQAYLAPIMDAIERAIDANERVVLIVDEFPWLCRNIIDRDRDSGRFRVDLLLAGLRKWRDKGVRMLLLGSIGMAALGRKHGLDLNHLNDLPPLEVPPLSPDEATHFVDCLALGSELKHWTPKHTARLIEESAALYTSILQWGFLQLTIGNRVAPLERIEDIFADKIRPDLDAAFYTQFDRRIVFYKSLDKLAALLTRVLQKIVACPDPVEYQALVAAVGPGVDDADLGDALAILREDGFVTMRAPRGKGQVWRPASDLVRAWWGQRRGGRLG